MAQPVTTAPSESRTGYLPDAGDILARYGDMVYRIAILRCRNKENAEDIYSEVFLKYVERTKPFESPEHCKAWLIRVTINCCNRLFRSPWQQKTDALSETLPYFDEEKGEAFYAVQNLPERYRMVIHLFYFEQYTTAEIGKILGRSVPTIKTQLYRGREMLREALKGEFGDDK